MNIIIDTNVIYSALRSQKGISHKLLLMLGDNKYQAYLTAPLYLEYEEQLSRLVQSGFINSDVMNDVLDYVCGSMILSQVYFLWRPFLKDMDDDMVLEAAVASNCEYIVTHNVKDFKNIEKFGIEAIKPIDFYKKLEKSL